MQSNCLLNVQPLLPLMELCRCQACSSYAATMHNEGLHNTGSAGACECKWAHTQQPTPEHCEHAHADTTGDANNRTMPALTTRHSVSTLNSISRSSFNCSMPLNTAGWVGFELQTGRVRYTMDVQNHVCPDTEHCHLVCAVQFTCSIP